MHRDMCLGSELLVSAQWYKGFRAQAEFFSHYKVVYKPVGGNRNQ